MTEESTQLSEREREILGHLASGATNQQIANDLGISINTVKVHVRNIFGKVGVSSRSEATLYAVRTGIVSVATEGTTTAGGAKETEHAEAKGPAVPTDTPVPAVAPDEDTSTLSWKEMAAPLPQDGDNAPTHPVSVVPVPARQPAESMPIGETDMSSKRTKKAAAKKPASRNQYLLTVSILVGGFLLAAALIWFVIQQSETSSTPGSGGESPQPTVITGKPVPRWGDAPLSPLPVAHEAAAAASLDGSIFVIGGETAAGVTGSVWRYDPDSDTWSERSARPTPARDVQSVVLNGKIYVPGGEQEDGTISDRLDVYDAVRDSWSSVSALPEPRSAYGLVAFEGHMYLFGGWDGESVRDEVFVYDPDSDTWTEETTMPTARAYAGAVVADNKIYVIGGEDNDEPLTRNEVYLPDRDSGQWTAAAILPEPRSRFGIQSTANFIILVGGTPEATPFSYDIRTDDWRTFAEPQASLGMQPVMAQRDNSLFVVSSDSTESAAGELFELRLLYTVQIPMGG